MTEALGALPEFSAAYLDDANDHWPLTHRDLADRTERALLIESLTFPDDTDLREVYDALVKGGLAQGAVWEFLFLQRLAFGGKAVRWHDGRWRTPGFNKTNAYGQEPTPGHGRVKPQVPAMVERIRTLPYLYLRTPLSWREEAVVYIDPPYQGTTGYGFDAPRDEVVELAMYHAELHRPVFVAEAVPVRELLDEGWRATMIRAPKRVRKPNHAGGEEWLTWKIP